MYAWNFWIIGKKKKKWWWGVVVRDSLLRVPQGIKNAEGRKRKIMGERL